MISFSRIAAGTVLALAVQPVLAQTTRPASDAERQAFYDAVRAQSREQIRESYRKNHHRKPAPATALQNAGARKETPGGGPQASGAPLPADARFPGEYEELQAMFISWPYLYNNQGNQTNFIDTLTEYASIHAQLANGIQWAAKVYINVWTPADSNAVKKYMASVGMPLTNHRFFINKGDDFWARDFGPVSYYYGAQDSIGWVDFHYYPGRDSDDVLPVKWAATLGVPVTTSPVYFEGGNVLMDGSNNMTTSTAVYDLNSSNYGYSQQRTRDSLRAVLRLGRNDILPYLPHDGGTGHVDLYLDRANENTYVYTEMPAAMATKPSFPDYGIAFNNIDTLRTRSTSSGKPHRFYTIPLPTRDDGSWYASGNDYNNNYTRSYSNHVFVNKTIIQPIFSNAQNGNAAGDLAAMEALKAAYPGYTFVPIDMRAYDGFGGAIHCITKELPAENPLRFQHYAYRDEEAYQSAYPVDAVITNRSGIASATLFWRHKGATSSWTVVPMTNAPGNHWLGSIPATAAVKDSFEYYLSATSTNGKTLTYPMPGDAGPFRFYYHDPLSVPAAASFGLGNLYPNPATAYTQLEIIPQQPATVQVRILDGTGKTLQSYDYGTVSSRRYLKIATDLLAPGLYWLEVSGNGQRVATRKLVKY